PRSCTSVGAPACVPSALRSPTMTGTAIVRGPVFLFGVAAVASVLGLALLSAWSTDVQANSSGSAYSALGDEESLDSDLSKDLGSLVAHSTRISPIASWDGSIDGMKTLWFESGAKSGEGRYVKGVKEDSWTFWYENGRKRWE